jgi:hypothetical protein
LAGFRGEIRLEGGGCGFGGELLGRAFAGESGRAVGGGHIAHGAVEVAVLTIRGVAFDGVHHELELCVCVLIGNSSAGDVGAQFRFEFRRARPSGEGVCHSGAEGGERHASELGVRGDAFPCGGDFLDLADDTGRVFER